MLKNITIQLWFFITTMACYAGSNDSVSIVSISLPVINNENKIFQSLQYKFPFSCKAKIELSCFQINNRDSILLYTSVFKEIELKEGFHAVQLNLLKKESNTFFNKSFQEAAQLFKHLPAGVYETYLKITTDSNLTINKSFLLSVDSTLAVNSKLRSKLNNALVDVDPSKIAASTLKNGTKNTALNTEQLNTATSKINRKLRKSGISPRTEIHQGKVYSALYYQEWFLGRYELLSTNNLQNRIAKEFSSLKNTPSSLVPTNLEDFDGVSSSMKDLQKKDQQKYLTGNVDFNAVGGTGQEQGSQQDNNYVEFRAELETEVSDVPISIEGFYTTQDRNRQAKASYFRVHYDVAKNKEKLSKLINGYKNKFSETESKGAGLQSVYQSYLNNLSGEQSKLTQSLNGYGVDPIKLKQTDSKDLLIQISKNIDTSKLIGKDSTKNKTEADYQRLAKKKDSISHELKTKYERLQETQKKIDKYTKLLHQYEDKLKLDSGIVYKNIRKLENKEDVSYKDMAKAAADILPDGKAKKFVTGLTHFDIGIINQYESDYTASGQTLKGGSLGYDLGFVKTGISLGKTEYISRDGNVDQYSSLTVRGDFKPIFKQKIGLIYYSYSPSKKLLSQDTFFKSDVAIPSFQNPVHIISVKHEGTIKKHFQLQNEIASSFKKTENKTSFGFDNMALKTSILYSIPKTSAELKGEYEHVGKDFENSSLPNINAATERYTLSSKADFFKAFLSVGLQYNFLKQESFASTGFSTKWGFDIKTNSKRYPNLYISYKPFSTFRAYNDTFSIAQRPLTGEVWIVKGSYQIKRKTISHRFMVIYNQNSTSTADTLNYSSRTLQLGYIYLSKGNMLNVNTGWMQLPQLILNQYSKTNSYFINLNYNKQVSKAINLMIGQDIAEAVFGLQRLATTIGTGYTFKKTPINLRVMLRYSNVKMDEATERKNLWQGQIGLNWRFKTKINSKKED